MKDLTITNELKRNKTKQSIMVPISILKIVPNLIQSNFFKLRKWEPPKKVLEDKSKSYEILTGTVKASLKHSRQSDKAILQIISGDTIEFQNQNSVKQNEKNKHFFQKKRLKLKWVWRKC